MGKRGPPPRGEYEGKTAVLSTRIMADTRAAIEAAAAANKRSLSQEIEGRLRRSFIEDGKNEAAFGSRANYALMCIVAKVIDGLNSARPGKADWLGDPQLFQIVVASINGVLDRLKPPGAMMPTADQLDAGHLYSAIVVEQIKTANPALPMKLPMKKTMADNHLRGILKVDLGDTIESADTEVRFPSKEEKS